MRRCEVAGCSAKHAARGYCTKHYMRLRRTGTVEEGVGSGRVQEVSVKRRIEANIERVDDCLVWFKATNKHGYGVTSVGSKRDGSRRTVLTHRLAYEVYVGDIPDDMHVLHTCDTPPCVNPDHLWLGTHSDNMQDMHAKGRWPMTSRTV